MLSIEIGGRIDVGLHGLSFKIIVVTISLMICFQFKI